MFWCKFGGVLGGGGESIEDSEGVDAAEEGRVDGSDILLHAVEDDIREPFWYFLSQWPKAVLYGGLGCGGLDGAMKIFIKKMQTHDSDKSLHPSSP